MENHDLHKWSSHRADMLWVSMKALMLITVGVVVAIALGGLGDASMAISIAVGAFGFFLWFCAFGAVMDIASMRNDMSDDLRAVSLRVAVREGAVPCLHRLDDAGDARRAGHADRCAQRLSRRFTSSTFAEECYGSRRRPAREM